MERESFVFYRSFYNCLKNLPIEERDALSMAILGYALDGIEPNLDGVLIPMFELIRPQIDANNKRFMDGQKGGAPKGNKNAKKERGKTELASNLGNQYKTTSGGIENNQWLNEKQPNVNVNVNVNDNVNDNEKECEGRLDAYASRGKNKDTVGKKNDSMKLSDKLKALGLEDEVIELAVTYDGCKKGKKLSKFDDKQLGIRVKKLKEFGYDCNEGMKQVLENSISNGYQGIFELKAKPVVKQKVEEGKVVNVNGANIFF